MLRVVNLTIFVCSLLIPVFSGGLVAAEEGSTPNLIITEVKVRFDTTNPLDYDEFIELYNVSDAPVDLANFYLEYYNATNPTPTQQPVQKSLFQSLLGAGKQLVLAKQPLQVPNSQQSSFSSLSDSGGRLRLTTSEGIVIDEIAWTNSASLATTEGIHPVIVYQCNSSTALCSSNRSKSISRGQDIDGKYIISNAGWSLTSPSPQSSELLDYPASAPEPDPIPDPSPTPDPVVPTPLPSTTTCEGVVLSELLPNPSGTDTGHEFIELSNPTSETIQLKGCSLQTTANSSKYALPDLTIDPGMYVVFSDIVTGLTLPNSAGGTVWLLSPTEELSTSVYPANMEDDASWSYVNGRWQISYTPTPGVANILLDIKPCPSGQVRNTTNKCQNTVITTVATLTPCKAGQERNPETGRCRAVASTVSALVACKAGQERNPETNRCRNTTASSELTPCPEGQERNPDTNRCRKVSDATSSTLAAVTDVPSATAPNHPKWWLALGAVLIALGYAAFEWRQDMVQQFVKLKTKVRH